MYNTELYIIKLFFTNTIYTQYNKYLKVEFIKANSKELFKLYEAVEEFHKNFPNKDISSVAEFAAFFYACYPAASAKEKDVFNALFEKLDAINPQPEVAEEFLRKHTERVEATELGLLSLEVAQGTKSYADLQSFLTSLNASRSAVNGQTSSEFVEGGLDDLFTSVVGEGGSNWRLRSLRESLGPLRKGDFGTVFARPETGKTTFLTDQASYMLEHATGHLIHFNNEEEGKKVKVRYYQSLFGITLAELYKNKDHYQKEFNAKIGDRLKIYDSSSIHRRDAERIIAQCNPSLILFDQLDKLAGFSDDRYDLEMKQIYQWAREIAKAYAPTIGVCQAGGTAENKFYLSMDDMDSSKTAKQGEADWILGIGMSHNGGMESIRGFSLPKNKLIGDKNTDPKKRHHKWEVKISPEIGRYEDLQTT